MAEFCEDKQASSDMMWSEWMYVKWMHVCEVNGRVNLVSVWNVGVDDCNWQYICNSYELIVCGVSMCKGNFIMRYM